MINRVPTVFLDAAENFACVCMRVSAHRKLHVRTRLKDLCVQTRLLFKDFRDVLYRLRNWNELIIKNRMLFAQAGTAKITFLYLQPISAHLE